MSKSLLEQLPHIVKEGRKQAERILESLETRSRVRLQTREVVLPAKDSAAQDWIQSEQRAERQAALQDKGDGADWTNRLIYGDNLLAMAALLAGDEHTPITTKSLSWRLVYKTGLGQAARCLVVTTHWYR